jgi:hypothetical protein
MEQAICKLKMVKCNWNVIKSNNSQSVWGCKRIIFFLVNGCKCASTNSNQIPPSMLEQVEVVN